MSSADTPVPTIHLHQIALRIHPADAQDDAVDVSVFVAKLNALVSALKASDKALNGKSVHRFKIAKLQSSSPTVLISEIIPRGQQIPFQSESPVRALGAITADVIDGVNLDEKRFGDVYKAIARLSSGARRTFEYAELWASSSDVFRIDGFLEERARRTEPLPTAEVLAEQKRFFTGVALSDFDGILDFVDLRGSLPAIKLAMTIGGGQLDCVCRNVDIEKIRHALKKRAIVSGKAIYDGSGPLPRRVEVSDIRLHAPGDDFSRWKGSIAAFDRVQIGDFDDE